MDGVSTGDGLGLGGWGLIVAGAVLAAMLYEGGLPEKHNDTDGNGFGEMRIRSANELFGDTRDDGTMHRGPIDTPAGRMNLWDGVYPAWRNIFVLVVILAAAAYIVRKAMG